MRIVANKKWTKLHSKNYSSKFKISLLFLKTREQNELPSKKSVCFIHYSIKTNGICCSIVFWEFKQINGSGILTLLLAWLLLVLMSKWKTGAQVVGVHRQMIIQLSMGIYMQLKVKSFFGALQICSKQAFINEFIYFFGCSIHLNNWSNSIRIIQFDQGVAARFPQ